MLYYNFSQGISNCQSLLGEKSLKLSCLQVAQCFILLNDYLMNAVTRVSYTEKMQKPKYVSAIAYITERRPGYYMKNRSSRKQPNRGCARRLYVPLKLNFGNTTLWSINSCMKFPPICMLICLCSALCKMLLIVKLIEPHWQKYM